MRITPGAQPIQTQKAQQAWEARRAARTTSQQAPASLPAMEMSQPTAAIPAPPVSAPTTAATAADSPQWNRKVQEIQNIAAKAGFLGVSEQDIRRAYSQGTSLLADYRV